MKKASEMLAFAFWEVLYQRIFSMTLCSVRHIARILMNIAKKMAEKIAILLNTSRVSDATERAVFRILGKIMFSP